MPQTNYQNGSGLVGAITGAIAGTTGEQIITRGSEINIAGGSTITFQLEEPLSVVTWVIRVSSTAAITITRTTIGTGKRGTNECHYCTSP